ncbi:protein mono-ADP-ribosyltransferase PARP4 [Nematolebias whitei]|uniref:protein mono-ADP-ribosyltransferase PARP4 n=1 Tax=Nematolebias whitei TaxID=451745 RepID=UPI001898E589|nr:protein mono-ADP-ribosyltransferase PARP4 [Nematolebias whitei]
MLRALAQAGGGAYEFFDTKTKHTWAEKVLRQVKRMSSPGCSSISVKWQQFNPAAPPPVQAPKQLNALFNDHHTLVYGLVPHCTQATLVGDLRGQELQTMVSTTELQKTRGTFLHKLTARALIRDYEDGSLETTEAEHEGKKAELKSFIVELSKEFSVLSQFTSFVAIEERDQLLEDGVTDVPKLIAEEDVDILPYISWTSPQDTPIPTIEGDGLLQTCSFDEVMMDIDRNNFEEYDVSYYCLPQAVSQRLDIEDSYFSEDDKMSRSERAPRSVGSVAGYHPIRIAAFDSDSGNAAAKLMRRSRRFSKECDDVRYYCPPQAGWDSEDSSVSEEDQSSGSERSPSAAEAHVSACSVLDYEPSADSALSDGSALMGGRTFGFLHKPLELALTAREQPPKPQGFTFGHSGSAGPCFGSAPVPFGSAPRSFVSAAGYFPPPPEPVALEEPVSVLQAVASDRRRHPAQIAAFDSDSGNAAAEVMRRRSLSSEMVAERLERKPSAYVRTNIERQRRYNFPPLDTALVKQKAKAPEGVFSNIKFGKQLNFLGGPCRPQVCRFRVSQLEAQQHKWTQIFKLQDSDGYWELTTELGQLIHLNVDVFANEFLRKKGIRSLGSRAHADILRMIATLMVLQLMRVEQLEEGKLLRNLFHLEEASGLRPERWDQVKKAVDWVRWADWQYPCICSRLELGLSWESCTRQLLGFNKLPSFSPLTGLDLRVH